MHKRVFAFILVLLIGFFSLGLQVEAAAKFEYTIKTNFEILKNKTSEVSYIVEVKNKVSTPAPSQIVLPAVGKNVKNVSAAYADSKEIAVSFSEDSNTFRLQTLNAPSGNNKKWSFSLNYQSRIGATLGNSFIAQIPVLDFGELDVVSHTISMISDLDLGVAVEKGPESNSSQIIAGNQVTRWSRNNGPYKKTVGLLFGENGVAEFMISRTLSNDSFWWKTHTLTLPPDTNQQQVFLENIDPAPTSIRLDVDGNILAEYLLRPRQSVDVTARAQIAVNNFTYSLGSTQLINDIPADISSRYTQQTDVWFGGHTDLTFDSNAPAVEIIEKIYDEVAKLKIEGESNYEQAKNRADALVGELRANGIPARTVLGKTFNVNGQINNEPADHAWVEAYAPGVGWISLDPTQEAEGPTFGQTDVTRVGLVLRGIEDSFPPEQLADSKVGYIEDKPIFENVEMVPRLTAVNYMILPGLALRSIEVSMPAGVIVDGAAVQADGESPHSLGSLAPLQTSAARSFVFAGTAFSAAGAIYGILTGDFIENPVAQTTTQVNYIPMLVIFGGGGLLFLIIFWIRKMRRRKKTKVSNSKHSITYATENDGGEIENTNLIPGIPKTVKTSDDTISTKENNQSKPKRRFRRNKRKPTEIR